MDTGLLRNNTVFYEGFEGDDEIVFELASDPSFNIHLWCGYLDDILHDPDLSGRGWLGLTRAYHQIEGPFSGTEWGEAVSPKEYLTDILQYQGLTFEYPESTDVLALLIEFFKYAINAGSEVVVRVD